MKEEEKTSVIPSSVQQIQDLIKHGSEKRENDFSEIIEKFISTSGTLKLTEDEKNKLYSDFEEHEIQIRPDGLIYVPWTIYDRRMRDVFGNEWTMIPQGMPKVHDNLITWGFHLIVRGTYADFSIGEQKYYKDNAKMTLGDACEGAKSNAFTRLCKRIGIGHKLYDRQYGEEWKKKYAESRTITNNNGSKSIQWFKK